MTHIQFSKKSNPNLTVNVFDQDTKKTYFHDKEGTPDYMDTSKFNEEYQQE